MATSISANSIKKFTIAAPGSSEKLVIIDIQANTGGGFLSINTSRLSEDYLDFFKRQIEAGLNISLKEEITKEKEKVFQATRKGTKSYIGGRSTLSGTVRVAESPLEKTKPEKPIEKEPFDLLKKLW